MQYQDEFGDDSLEIPVASFLASTSVPALWVRAHFGFARYDRVFSRSVSSMLFFFSPQLLSLFFNGVLPVTYSRFGCVFDSAVTRALLQENYLKSAVALLAWHRALRPRTGFTDSLFTLTQLPGGAAPSQISSTFRVHCDVLNC